MQQRQSGFSRAHLRRISRRPHPRGATRRVPAQVEKYAALWRWPDPALTHTSWAAQRPETRIGTNARRLRNRRNDADYEVSASVSKQFAESMQ